MADERVNFVLGARDSASATINRVQRELNELGVAGGKAGGPLAKLGTITGGLVSPAGLAIGAATALTAGLVASTGAASDNEEALNKLRVVYGANSADLEKFASSSARSLGMSNTAALGALGTFGNLFVAMGTGQQPAANMSKNLVQLAADLASFNNLDPTEVLEKLRAGIVGEAEPLRTLGVNISDVRTKAKALELGLYSGTGALSAVAKAQANYALILEDTRTAQGDYARTSDGLANSQRSLGAMVDDLAVKAGRILLPVLTDLVHFLSDVGIPALEGFIGFLSTVGQGVSNIATSFREAAGDVHFFAMNFGDEGAKVHALADELGIDFDTLKDRIRDRMLEAGVDFATAFQDISGTARAEMLVTDNEVRVHMTAMAETVAEQGARIAADWKARTGEMPQAVRDRFGEMRAAGFQQQVEYAKGILDGQNAPKVQMEALKQMQEEELTEAAEIARLKGQLNSRQLASGLRDERDGVRAQAQATRQAIVDRLARLGVDGYSWGRNIGTSFASGLDSTQGVVRTAAGGLAAAAEGQIGIRSEPKDPSSPLRGLTRWGGNLVRTYAADMLSQIGTLRSAAAQIAAAAVPGAALVPATAGAGGVVAPNWSGAGSAGNVFNFHFGRDSIRSDEDIQALARELARIIRLNS